MLRPITLTKESFYSTWLVTNFSSAFSEVCTWLTWPVKNRATDFNRDESNKISMCQSFKGSDSVLFKPVQLNGKTLFSPFTIMSTAAQSTTRRTGPRRYKAAESGSHQQLLCPCIPSAKVPSHWVFILCFQESICWMVLPCLLNRVSWK